MATGAAARPVWEQAAAADAAATVSQTPAWLDAIREAAGVRDATRVYETADGRRLVLPLAARGPERLRSEESLPFGWSSGGLLSPDGPVREADVAAVLADLLGRPVLRTAIRPAPAADALWAAAAEPGRVRRTPRMAHELDLDGGFQVVWERRFTTKVRRYCRRAERAGVQVESDATGNLVPVFAGLYRLSVARWAAQQHEPLALARWRARRRDPPRKLELVARGLGERCRVWVARREGEPVAAIVVLRHGAHATYWRGAMDKERCAGTGANELLHAMAIEDACRTGALRYHLGDSSPSSSLAYFKGRFGASEQPYCSYLIERLPLSRVEDGARRTVKRALRFRDA